jgi:hypothetical protein
MMHEMPFDEFAYGFRRLIRCKMPHTSQWRELEGDIDEVSTAFGRGSPNSFVRLPPNVGDCPEIGGIMINAVRPVGYVAGWGGADGMDATIGWNGG